MSVNSFEDKQYRRICSEKTLQSNEKGYFLDFYNFVSQEGKAEWIKSEFGKLKNDYERIKFVYTSKKTQEYLKTFLSNVQEVFRPKNDEISLKARLEADKLMKQQKYDKSLLLYSQSVIRAPKTGPEKQLPGEYCLALALWGRSQVSLALGQFENSLSDILQAVKEGLPYNCKAQAFWNMGLCYRELGEEKRAIVSFELAEKMSLQNQENLNKTHHGKQKTLNRGEKQNHLSNYECPKIQDSNPNLPSASSKLSVESSGKMGRYMVAKQDIEAGETLVVEAPYAACLLHEMSGSHCHNCFKRLKLPIGCQKCSSIAFCSVKCRDEALSTYHSYECKYSDLLFGSGMSILGNISLRMVTQYGLAKSLDIYKTRSNQEIYRLCTNSDARSPEDFLQRTLMAALLLRCLQKSGFFNSAVDRVLPSEIELHIGAMLLFNLQMLQFNAHEIYEQRSSGGSTSKSICIGVGVYKTASLFNHDCHLAISRHFSGKDIVLTSIRPIRTNSLVPENYGPQFTRKPLSERKRILLSRYWFDCQCLSCQQNWPAIDQGLETVSKRIRCPTYGCTHLFIFPIKKNITTCRSCKKSVDLSERISLLKWCEEQRLAAVNLMEKFNIAEAIDVLCSAVNTFYRISVPPHKEMQIAEEMLSRCISKLSASCEE